VLLGTLETVYILATLALALYGWNSLWMTLTYLWTRRRGYRLGLEARVPTDWPRVTVQLPTYNERYTVQRLIEAVMRLDYPQDRLEIHILDDSTDGTVEEIDRLVESFQHAGADIRLFHRQQRLGFKAGALAAGLAAAKGEYIAIFDADFLPARDWLRRTIPHFSDPRLACVQTRWAHLNGQETLLTQAEGLALDAHFIVEQQARSGSHLFMSFNGTAGIWRRAAIDDAGGWTSDTLTEDLDLSYRAQLHGWRIRYLPEIAVPGELPADINAFKAQQFRWAKGGLQTARKLLPAIWRARLPVRVKVGASLHLTGYLAFPLMLLTFLLVLPVGYLNGHMPAVMGVTLLAAFGPPFMYAMAQSEHLPRLSDRLRVLPVVILLGFGLSVNNGLGAIQGLLLSGGEFTRTPKGKGDSGRAAGEYRSPLSPSTWVELILAAYAFFTLDVLLRRHAVWVPTPWVIAYGLAYLFVGGQSLLPFREWGRQALRLSPPPAGS
jgi:cellulose synthase/poly-beta-1,6-N-acetylglucosamine synthase-like glycosyltransferase